MRSGAPKIVAHRGGPRRTPENRWPPENTLSAFRRAIDDGADGFECDVVLTRDGEPVVFHKPFYSDSISKLTNERGKLKDLDWRTLKEIKTNGERIPHLNDTLEYISSSRAECFIEPKIVCDEVVDKILTAVARYRVENRVRLITFFNRRSLLCISKERDRRITTSVILVSPFGNWQHKAAKACADIIVPGWKGHAVWKSFNHLKLFGAVFVDLKSKIEKAQKGNLPVYSGIADDEENVRWLCDLGVDGIFTNNVRLAKQIVDRAD